MALQRQAQRVVIVRKSQSSQAAQRLVTTVETFLSRVEQVLDQTVHRVFQGEIVPATEKIVSLFEAHSAIIRRKKPGKESEFGHKVWLDEVDGGLVTCWQVLTGNPDDAEQWAPAMDHHSKQFGHPPGQASADRALYSSANEAYAHAKGVQHVILAKPGRKDDARRQHEQQP